MYILGIDPGPIPGIVRLQLEYGHGPTRLLEAEALQVTPRLIFPVLHMLGEGDRTVVAVERFVVGPRASRSSTPTAGSITRTMIEAIREWTGTDCITRAATEVKPWATDKRLAAAGLLEPLTTGMRHARDAARHALFCAVRDYGLPDPLSRVGGGV